MKFYVQPKCACCEIEELYTIDGQMADVARALYDQGWIYIFGNWYCSDDCAFGNAPLDEPDPFGPDTREEAAL